MLVEFGIWNAMHIAWRTTEVKVPCANNPSRVSPRWDTSLPSCVELGSTPTIRSKTHEDWLRNLAQGIHGLVAGLPFDSVARCFRDASPQSCWCSMERLGLNEELWDSTSQDGKGELTANNLRVNVASKYFLQRSKIYV